MDRRVSELVALAVRASGLPAIVRATAGRRRAAILVYHRPDPRVLDRHLRWLGRRHAFTALDTVVDAIWSGDWSAVPPRALVVTFDDGHRSNAALAEVLARHGVRPTIYLCSQVVGTTRGYWFHAASGERQRLKRLPSGQRRAELARRGFDLRAERGEERREALSTGELARLAPVADLESHTRFHPILTTCDDDECAIEIGRSRSEVESLTGRPCRHFSYPNGDHTEREQRLAREAGYRSARTIDLGHCDVHSDPYALPAYVVPDDASVNRMAAAMVPVGPTWLRRRLRGARGGRHPTTIAVGA